ncbi:MAG: hypothetical protein JO227_07025 [Acetobacteraceae bacterium]|nr:hypothetical protein [Acetobacteraceae bacterium]
MIRAAYLRSGSMRRRLAFVWLAVVLAAGAHIGYSLARGINVQTDLMALLPREDRDPAVQQAKDALARLVSERVVIMVGHADATAARGAAQIIRSTLSTSGLLAPTNDVPDLNALRRLGEVYAAHSDGLLANADRARLLDQHAEAVLARAQAQVFGFAAISDGRMLSRDPFLLLPAFLADLPIPASRLAIEQGWPTITNDGVTWVLVSGELRGESSALSFQRRFTQALHAALNQARAVFPDVRVLRLGSVFYAHAGAEAALHEASAIGSVSLAGTVLLVLLVFRRPGPLALALLAIAAGLTVALSACLLLFGAVHTAAQLFGASLIGIAVDYALLYAGQIFSSRRDASARIAHILPGITLGMATTVLGYATLALSPFPGLRQVAALSALGLIASFLTVVLWFPLLDRAPCRPLPSLPRILADRHWSLFSRSSMHRVRMVGLAVTMAIGVIGSTRLQTDDDVRRQQALAPALLRQQAEIEKLTGFSQTSQFFLVQAGDEETVLRREEALGDRLSIAVQAGTLAGWRSPALFVPSTARQQENRALVGARLAGPYLAAWRSQLGMTEESPAPGHEAPLLIDSIASTRALPILDALRLSPTLHVVMLDAVLDPATIGRSAEGLDGVRFVDPTADVGTLLAAYRHRALVLPMLSAPLMLPLLVWRYGLHRAMQVMVPPILAVALTPAILALAGLPFSFFTAMALVLVFSIGVDYAVFCAEDGGRRDPVVLVSVALCMAMTLLSFGSMAASSVAGMRAFGATMGVGVALAFLLAPTAAGGQWRKRDAPVLALQ